jgi:hypothetical protein
MRGTGLTPRLVHHLATGLDWPIFDHSFARRSRDYEATEAELRAAWNEHGERLLAWAAGDLQLPEIAHRPHLCQYTAHPRSGCTAACSHRERRQFWALTHFGHPAGA